jgi:uncharacterized protein YkwD
MRIWIGIALTAACGPVAQSRGGQAPPAVIAANEPAGPPAPEEPRLQLPGAPPTGAAASSDGAAASSSDGDPDEDGAAEPLVEPAAARRAASPGDATAWVDAHNRFRAKHCAAALTWSTKLAEVAQRWANALRDRGCQFGHSNGSYGENLAAGTSGTLDPGSVVKMWYDEIAEYRFPDGGFSMKTGHFTQVVWRGTKQVGCGRSQCKGMDIYVCEYAPPGNWEGQYRENVLPRGCH